MTAIRTHITRAREHCAYMRTQLQDALERCQGVEVLAVMPLIEQAASLQNQLAHLLSLLPAQDTQREDGSI